MSFTPPLFKSVRGIEFDHLFISAWNLKNWEAENGGRKKLVIEVETILNYGYKNILGFKENLPC